jgi:Bacterial membrane protein YfhO
VSGERAALDAVLEPGFDPAAVAVLESNPGSTPSASSTPGTAVYREVAPEDVRIEAEASVPSILLVRNAWDEGWSATLDGRSVPLLRTDGFLQGIALPPGRHDVRLTYREPAIATGLALSGIAWLGFAVALVFVIVRGRFTARGGAGGSTGPPAPGRAQNPPSSRSRSSRPSRFRSSRR